MREGLSLMRVMMVLSSMAPLFLLWAVRGVAAIPDRWLIVVCGLLIVIPYALLCLRLQVTRRQRDTKTLTIGAADDHREHLLVYLFAMLIPLYDANLGTVRDAWATILAFGFVVFLFWHLNLHYMNLFFALRGYRVFTIYPPSAAPDGGGQQPLVLLTRRTALHSGQTLTAYRLSNTVFYEIGDHDATAL